MIETMGLMLDKISRIDSVDVFHELTLDESRSLSLQILSLMSYMYSRLVEKAKEKLLIDDDEQQSSDDGDAGGNQEEDHDVVGNEEGKGGEKDDDEAGDNEEEKEKDKDPATLDGKCSPTSGKLV